MIMKATFVELWGLKPDWGRLMVRQILQGTKMKSKLCQKRNMRLISFLKMVVLVNYFSEYYTVSYTYVIYVQYVYQAIFVLILSISQCKRAKQQIIFTHAKEFLCYLIHIL